MPCRRVPANGGGAPRPPQPLVFRMYRVESSPGLCGTARHCVAPGTPEPRLVQYRRLRLLEPLGQPWLRGIPISRAVGRLSAVSLRHSCWPSRSPVPHAGAAIAESNYGTSAGDRAPRYGNCGWTCKSARGRGLQLRCRTRVHSLGNRKCRASS